MPATKTLHVGSADHELYDRIAQVAFACTAHTLLLPIDASEDIMAMQPLVGFLTRVCHEGPFTFKKTSFRRMRRFLEWLRDAGAINIQVSGNAIYMYTFVWRTR